MGHSIHEYSELAKSRMVLDDRKALGPAAVTFTEADEKRQRMAERELHKTFIAWCRVNDLEPAYARMDRKSTLPVGYPDFTITANNHGCHVEFKADGGELSPEQVERIRKLRAVCSPVLITTSVVEAIEWVKGQLEI